LTRLPVLFFSTALWLALHATLPGTAADTIIHKNIGGQVRDDGRRLNMARPAAALGSALLQDQSSPDASLPAIMMHKASCIPDARLP